ncbi:SCO4402 family protein [Phormidesmis sp. 146-33]
MNEQFSTYCKLEYPCIRDELLRVLHQIKDAETQIQNWVSQESLSRTETNRLSTLLQFVYVTTSLTTEPDFTIGLFLKDIDEVRSVWAIYHAVEQVFQTAGVDAACESYIACSEWSNLLQAVDRALQTMHKCNFSEFIRFRSASQL